MANRFPLGGVAGAARKLPRAGYALAKRASVPSASNRFEGFPAASAAVSFSAVSRSVLSVWSPPCASGAVPVGPCAAVAFIVQRLGKGLPSPPELLHARKHARAFVSSSDFPLKSCALWRRCHLVDINERPCGTRRALMPRAKSGPDTPRGPCPVLLIFCRLRGAAPPESAQRFALSLPGRA